EKGPEEAKTTETHGADLRFATPNVQSSVCGPSPKYKLHFAVRDTGVGIPVDRMDRLFHSFSQVDSSTTRKYGGTGLELVISKQLSEMMGGTMWAESEEGKGSTFHFTVEAQAAPIQRQIVHLQPEPMA